MEKRPTIQGLALGNDDGAEIGKWLCYSALLHPIVLATRAPALQQQPQLG